MMAEKQSLTDEQLAQKWAKYLTGMLWHVGAFIIINVFFWLLDLLVGQEGLQWAFWITLSWGFALLFHVVAWFIGGRQLDPKSPAVPRRRTAHRSLSARAARRSLPTLIESGIPRTLLVRGPECPTGA
jgi:MFS family permease